MSSRGPSDDKQFETFELGYGPVIDERRTYVDLRQAYLVHNSRQRYARTSLPLAYWRQPTGRST